MVDVCFLGTGFSLPTRDRHAISLHVRGAHGVLVDAGGDPAAGLARAGGLRELDAVVITHGHTDHVGGLPGLVHALRFVDRTRPLHVAALLEVLDALQAACRALDARAPYGLEWVPLDPAGGAVVVGGAMIRTAPADHTVPALAVRIGGVAYSSDTRPCDAIAELARGADLLVHEATHADAALMERTKHSSPAEAGDVARRAGARGLAIVHTHPSMDAAEAARQTGFAPVWAPRDGDRLVQEGASWRLAPREQQVTW